MSGLRGHAEYMPTLLHFTTNYHERLLFRSAVSLRKTGAGLLMTVYKSKIAYAHVSTWALEVEPYVPHAVFALYGDEA